MKNISVPPRRALIVGAVVILAAIAAWDLGLFGSGQATSGPLTLYGNIEIRQANLGFRIAGRLAAMNFDEGQSVAKGTLLAELDARPYQDKVAEAQAQVAEAQANYDKVKNGPRPAEIAEARANLAEQQANLTNAQIALSRSQKLRRTGVASQASLDDAEAAQRMGAARVAADQSALALLLEGSRPEDIAAAHANLLLAQATLAAAQTDLADTRLMAPEDGVILSRVVEPGAILGPSNTVYVLSLTKPVWVRAYIEEPELGRIHPGMEVTLTNDTAPRHVYHGHIGFISPVAEFTPKSVETPELRTDLVYRFRVIVDDADQGLRQGMPVTLEIPQAGGAK